MTLQEEQNLCALVALQQIDTLTALHCAAKSFRALVFSAGGYRPTLLTSAKGRRGVELTILADAYDTAQVALGTSKRVFRQ